MENNILREKIISESIELFMKYGLRSVTMDDIAKHMGISKKTIYMHFKDKEEIITIATSTHFANELKVIQEIENESQNAVEQLYYLTSCLRERTKNTNSNLLFDLKKYYKEAWQNYLKYKHDVIFNSVLKNLKRGIEEGLFRSDINPDILAYLRIGQIELSFNKEYFPDDKYTIGEIHEQLMKHFTYGILSEKGFKLLETYKQKAI